MRLRSFIPVLCLCLIGCGSKGSKSTGSAAQTARRFLEICYSDPKRKDETERATILISLVPQEMLAAFQDQYSLKQEQMTEPILKGFRSTRLSLFALKEITSMEETEPATSDIQTVNENLIAWGLDLEKIEEIIQYDFEIDYYDPDPEAIYATYDEPRQDSFDDIIYLYNGKWYSYRAALFLEYALYSIK